MAYCQFNQKEMVAGLIHMNRSIECMIPKGVTGKTQVRLSFNGINWTNEMDYEYTNAVLAIPRRTPVSIAKAKKPKQTDNGYVSPIYLVCFVSVTCIACGWLMFDSKKEKSSDEPMVEQMQPEDRPRKRGVRARAKV